MKPEIFFPAVLAIICLSGCANHQKVLRSEASQNTANDVSALYNWTPAGVSALDEEGRQYYLVLPDDADVDWDERIPCYHYWKNIRSDEYFFDAPSAEQIIRWEALCEERQPKDSVDRGTAQGHFHNLNQYVTVYDFVELWFAMEQPSYEKDDALTLWRLEQFNTKQCNPLSEYERFNCLKERIEQLCDYEPCWQVEYNRWSGLKQCFQEFYARILLDETVKHSYKNIAAALVKEESAWQKYHSVLNSVYQIIDGSPDGMNGSAWGMSVCGIAEEDALTRSIALEDYYFSISDSLALTIGKDSSEFIPEKHQTFDEKAVEEEYRHFMDYFKEEEYYFPVFERKKALNREMTYWRKWMNARDKVSAMLDGAAKEYYDNATNNIRRRKLIMLKNRYEGYGVTSDFITSCLLSYDCHDSEIADFSFERNLESY